MVMGDWGSGLAIRDGLAAATGTGMIRGMTSAKVAISLPKEVLARARAAVRRGDAPSLSAYVSQALAEKTNEDDIMQMLNEMLEETGGPLTPEEIRWADGVLGITKKRHRKPKHLK
jgi:Arc/MetJ-type ribon-helix-helix transcriptional regulator